VAGQDLGHAFPHLADAQGEDKLFQGRIFRGGDGQEEISHRFFPRTLQGQQFDGGKGVDVRRVLDQCRIHQPGDHFSPQAFDVHASPGGEMDDPLLDLGGAGNVDAAMGRFSREADYRGSAYRA